MQTVDEVEEIESVKSVSRPREVLGLIRKNKGALIGGLMVLVFLGVALAQTIATAIGVRITPYDPLQLSGLLHAPPSWAHLLGTDNFGRDVFSRVFFALPNDAEISFAVIAVALIVGTLIGTFAAFRGGLLGEALMRATDVFFAIPALILAIAIAVALGNGLLNINLALLIIWWPAYARLARGEALKVSHQNFIEASKLAGRGTVKISFGHVIPNIFLTMIVYATLDIGTVVLVYSGISYFGIGVQPPHPELGNMVSLNVDYILVYPWLPLIPGIIIALLVVSYSVFGDGLRDALEAV